MKREWREQMLFDFWNLDYWENGVDFKREDC